MIATPNVKRLARWLVTTIAALVLCTRSADAWLTPGPETVLYDFHGSDGSAPYQLVEGVDGTLYGATAGGGAYGAGTVFALKPPTAVTRPWTLTVMASIPAGLPGQLVIDPTGAFAVYGSTPQGGQDGPYHGYCDYFGHNLGCGSVFRVAPPAGGRGDWTTGTIYEFSGASDGGEPYGLITSGGSLFGLAGAGGYPSCYGRSGCGGAFRLTPPAHGQTAWSESLPIAFIADSSGLPPSSALLGAGNGDAYGMFSNGDGTQSVFSFNRYAFATFGSEGTPAGVVVDERGVVYIWTSTAMLYALSPPNFRKELILRLPASGVFVQLAHSGAVFLISSRNGKRASLVALVQPVYHQTGWQAQILHTFSGGSDGGAPNAVIVGKSGDVYGTTAAGGIANNGVIYRVSLQRPGRVNR